MSTKPKKGRLPSNSALIQTSEQAPQIIFLRSLRDCNHYLKSCKVTGYMILHKASA